MGKKLSLVGKRFGSVVVAQSLGSLNGKTRWLCKCDCGCEFEAGGPYINANRITHCGCKKRDDINGKIFGRLTVVGYSHSDGGRAYWKCKCSCGEKTVSSGTSLRTGRAKTCGCSRFDVESYHGMHKESLYGIWNAMLNRCRNPKVYAYNRYGGRGINVCDRWLDFKNFRDDMHRLHILAGQGMEHCQLDRIDNDGDYEPLNCRWTTRAENLKNRDMSGVRMFSEAQVVKIRAICSKHPKRIGQVAKEYGAYLKTIKDIVNYVNYRHVL